jgi:glycosyltransferase involved in cell wall biosynthesis
VNEILQAFATYRQSKGEGRLVLVGNGSGSYVEQLQRLARELGVSDSVEFCGWLVGSAKYRQMSRAHALLMASAREGWGLVVTECNACGTPAIVYDVAGLRDSVRQLETGLVVTPTPACLAEGMLQLANDPELYQRLREAAQRWSQTFTYEAGTRIVLETIASVVTSGA